MIMYILINVIFEMTIAATSLSSHRRCVFCSVPLFESQSDKIVMEGSMEAFSWQHLARFIQFLHSCFRSQPSLPGNESCAHTHYPKTYDIHPSLQIDLEGKASRMNTPILQTYRHNRRK